MYWPSDTVAAKHLLSWSKDCVIHSLVSSSYREAFKYNVFPLHDHYSCVFSLARNGMRHKVAHSISRKRKNACLLIFGSSSPCSSKYSDPQMIRFSSRTISTYVDLRIKKIPQGQFSTCYSIKRRSIAYPCTFSCVIVGEATLRCNTH